MRRGLTLAFLLLGLIAHVRCGPPVEDTPRTGRTGFFEWAILPAGSASAFGLETDEPWQPAPETVERALAGIRAYLDEQREIELDEEESDTFARYEMLYGVREKLPAYKCQVVGFVEKGRRLVYLNFVHYMSLEAHPDDDPAELEDWTRDPHVVSDGGDHYWQVVYDPATNEYLRLGINGEA